MEVDTGKQRSSIQSDEYAEKTSQKSKGSKKSDGCCGITFKDTLNMLFALFIPAAIGILAVVLQKNEIDIEQRNRASDFIINQLQRDSDDQQTRLQGNDTVYNNFVQSMVNTILTVQIYAGDSPQYNLTRVLTLNALRQLSLDKKALLIQFLYDVEFAKRGSFIFPMQARDEDVKNLKGANFDNVDLSNGLELESIVLRSASLVNTSFSNSHFGGADFSNSKLIGANFSGTILDGARFINTPLQQTDFKGASLKNAQFIQANLTQSTITDEQLSQALAIFNTILPNGTYARNKTFLNNGDAKQGTYGWNITSGIIQVKDFYFTGDKNSTMVQRIDTSDPALYATSGFDYCLSFFFHGQQKLTIQIAYFNQNNVNTDVKNLLYITSSSCNNSPSSSLDFCYWSSCASSAAEYMDLKIIFGYTDATTNIIAIKNIELTIIAE